MNDLTKFTPEKIASSSMVFSIPIYQRLFEWEDENITTLLNDLYSAESSGKGDYYIGILTAKSGDSPKILIDGQQRFTVMILLGCVLRNYYPEWKKFVEYEGFPRLRFPSRESDNRYMSALIKELEDTKTPKNEGMHNGIECIKKFLEDEKKFNDEPNKKKFARYVFEHLAFFVSHLPEEYDDTDLNIYFERMNTTGKNLEAHEILKVKLLRNLHNRNIDISPYMALWNNFADPFETLLRKNDKEETEDYKQRIRDALELVKKWDQEQFFQKIVKDRIKEEKERAIGEIAPREPPSKDASPVLERETSRRPLNFPQFLLQALYSWIKGKIDEDYTKERFFDPAHLLDTFAKYLPYESTDANADSINISQFMERLAKCGLALDLCFVRTMTNSDYELENWSKSDDLEQIKKLAMLESMLLVSTPTTGRVPWFEWLLDYVGRNGSNSNEDGLFTYLKENDDKAHPLPPCKDLFYPDINRYWFWRLDFYIWLWRDKYFSDKKHRQVVENYIFRRNRSIEHIAPQWPKQNSSFQWTDTEDDKRLRHSFGNLAMISSGQNSSLSNSPYEEKKARVESYRKGSLNGSVESLKLFWVFCKYDTWDKGKIKEHGWESYKLLEDSYKL